MKKFIFLLGLILISSQATFALELQCGVSYDVNSARSYLQDGQVNDIGPLSNLYFDGKSSNADVIYGYDKNNLPTYFAVRYKNDLNISYVYGMNNKLKYIDKYDRPSDIYPHRGYRYDTNGKLVNSTLATSKNNGFVFTPNGKLVARIDDGTGYLGNTNIVVFRQSNY